MKQRLLTYIIIFFSGFFLTLTVAFYSEWRYEEDILGVMARQINTSCKGKGLADVVDSTLRLTHRVVDPMAEIYSQEHFSPLKDFFISPSFLVYYYGQGACGGYSCFTARLLDKMNITTKFVQQNVDGVPGGHITLVVEDGKKLLLLDPLFAWSLRDTLGNMSDIRTVAANWAYYKRHKPPHYRSSYNYQNGWTHTNWNKLGGFSRGIYKIGVFFWGKEKMDYVSIHSYLLNTMKAYFFISLALCALFLAFLAKRYSRYKAITARRMRQDNTKPVYASNFAEAAAPMEYFSEQ